MLPLEKAFTLFDQYNQQDPQRINWEGTSHPAEYFYALQVHKWVTTLEPNAREPLLLASRCQHIGRWEVPRQTYPAGKAGYLKWRSDLALFHAEKAVAFLLQAGYNEPVIKEVQQILKKENLRTNHEVQVMEDALCLVFLQYQFNDFIKEHEDEKLIRIVQKTWRKMSDKGKKEAALLSLTGRGKELVQKALA